jgi:hypothetical protein
VLGSTHTSILAIKSIFVKRKIFLIRTKGGQ